MLVLGLLSHFEDLFFHLILGNILMTPDISNAKDVSTSFGTMALDKMFILSRLSF
jgi:hypothetical protein